MGSVWVLECCTYDYYEFRDVEAISQSVEKLQEIAKKDIYGKAVVLLPEEDALHDAMRSDEQRHYIIYQMPLV